MLLLALAAHADVPPPPGIKRVPYIVKVEGMTADRDPAVVVFPWSDSDGAPTSEVGVVGPMGLQFGRRVGGQPAFWLVPRAKLTEVADLEGDAAEAWMAANGERCEGSMNRVSEVPEGGPDAFVETFRLATGPCRLEAVPAVAEPTKAREAPKSGGCSTLPAPFALGALGMLAPLALRRRR